MADETTFTKADLDKAVKDATEAAVADATAKLDAKNKELIAELREAKRGKTIDPADVEKLESRIDELTTKLTAAEKAAKDATTAAEKAAKALEQESGFTHKLVAENGLLKALSDAGVTDPTYLDVAKAFHLPNVKVIAEGDARKAMYGDKPVDEAIKEWAASDAGKKLVAAPNNGGGGAPGGKGGSEGTKTMTRAAFDALDQGGRAKFSTDGGKVVDATT